MKQRKVFSNLYIPWDLNAKNPFNKYPVENQIGKAKPIIYSSCGAKICHSEKKHNNSASRADFIDLPILEYEFKIGHDDIELALNSSVAMLR